MLEAYGRWLHASAIPASLMFGAWLFSFALVAVFVAAAGHSVRRWFRRWRLRRELRVIRGDKPRPVFTTYGELEERRRAKPPIRSLRNRGDHNDAA